MMDPACEADKKRTREKKDENEVLEFRTNPPLDLDPKETIEVDEETLPYAEEDWEKPELLEVPQNIKPDLPFSMLTRQSDRERPPKTYNPYGDDLEVDQIDLKRIAEDLVGLEEITASQEVDLVDDQDN